MGGVTTHVIDLCKELVRSHVKTVLVFDDENCDYWDAIREIERVGGFSYAIVKMGGILSNVGTLLRIATEVRKIVKKEKINIIHTHSQSLCVVGAIVKFTTGVPYIWTNHIDEIANPRLFRIIIRFLHFPIISVSTDLKELLIREYGINKDRITVISNGIDPRKFELLSDEEKQHLISVYECSGKYVVSILARMTYGKGHIYLLKAVNELQIKYGIKGIKILIAGKIHDNEKTYAESLMQFANENGIDVKFLGFQNPRDVFGVSDIGILPSLYEGFGLTVIEGLLMSCPIIRSDTPGWTDMKDIVFVFKKGDTEMLAKQLHYAYFNRREMKNMGSRGREAVLKRFTVQKQVTETIRLYKRYVDE